MTLYQKISPDSSIPVSPKSDKVISSSQLIAKQHRDPDISYIFDRALQGSEMSEDPVFYYTNSGILMRPPDASVDDNWLVKYQIVIPKLYRMDILKQLGMCWARGGLSRELPRCDES